MKKRFTDEQIIQMIKEQEADGDSLERLQGIELSHLDRVLRQDRVSVLGRLEVKIVPETKPV